MDQLKTKLNEAKANIDLLTQKVNFLEKEHSDTGRKLIEVGHGILAEYRNIIGASTANLRQDEWTNWEQKETGFDYIDKILGDFLEKVKIKSTAWKEEVDNKNQDLLTQRNQLVSVGKALTIAEVRVDQLQTEIDAISAEKAIIEKEITQLSNSNKRVTEERDTAENKVVTLESKVGQITQNYAKLQELKSQLSEQYDQLKKNGEILQRSLNKAIEERDALSNDKAVLENSLDLKEKNIKDLEGVVDKLNLQIAQANIEPIILKNKIQELTRKLKEESERVLQLGLELEDNRRQSQSWLWDEYNRMTISKRLEGNVRDQTADRTMTDYDNTETDRANRRYGKSLFKDYENLETRSTNTTRKSADKSTHNKNTTIEAKGHSDEDSDETFREPRSTDPWPNMKNSFGVNKKNSLGFSQFNSMSKPTRSLEQLDLLVSKLVPTFSGAPSASMAIELDKYFEACEMRTEDARLGERDNLLRCFKKRLTGEAFQHVNLGNCNSYPEMKKLLKRVFKTFNTYDEHVKDLRNCRQQPGEETKTFVHRAERLYGMACSELDNKYHIAIQREAVKAELEQIAISTIRLGLSNEKIKIYLLQNPTRSMRDVITEIERYEKGLTEIKNHTTGNVINMINDPINNLTATVAALKERQDGQLVKIIRIESAMQELVNKIEDGFKNQNFGYRNQPNPSRNERNPQNPSRNDGQGRNGRNDNNVDNIQYRNRSDKDWTNSKTGGNSSTRYDRNGNIVECYNCRKLGHYATECRSMVCFYCKRGPDHDFNQCKEKWEAERNTRGPTSSNTGN